MPVVLEEEEGEQLEEEEEGLLLLDSSSPSSSPPERRRRQQQPPAIRWDRIVTAGLGVMGALIDRSIVIDRIKWWMGYPFMATPLTPPRHPQHTQTALTSLLFVATDSSSLLYFTPTGPAMDGGGARRVPMMGEDRPSSFYTTHSYAEKGGKPVRLSNPISRIHGWTVPRALSPVRSRTVGRNTYRKALPAAPAGHCPRATTRC